MNRKGFPRLWFIVSLSFSAIVIFLFHPILIQTDELLHLFILFNIKLLTQELEALRKEKTETDESRKAVEENLESTRKDYEEKVQWYTVPLNGFSRLLLMTVI